MLTRRDLQAIGEVVDKKVDEKITLVRDDLQAMGALIDRKLEEKLDKKLSPIFVLLDSIIRDINYIKRVLREVVDWQRENFSNHESRISKLEDKVFKN